MSQNKQPPAAGTPGPERDAPKANRPREEGEAARRSGQFGADKPGFGKAPPPVRREADKTPHRKGPEYEEGGPYPGKQPGDA